MMLSKLNEANAVLSQIRHDVHKKTLRTMQHAIFGSHLCYPRWFHFIAQSQPKDYSIYTGCPAKMYIQLKMFIFVKV